MPEYLKVPEAVTNYDGYANCTGCVAHDEDNPATQTELCRTIRMGSCRDHIYIPDTEEGRTAYTLLRLGVV